MGLQRRIAALFLSLFVLVTTSLAASQPDPPSTYPLKLSPDRSYVVDQRGRPFFINGDAAWSLIAQLSKEDAERYLENRRQKGFNTIIVELVEHKFAANAPANIYGDHPFIEPGLFSFVKQRYASFFHRVDFERPNEAYFAHADWVIRTAATKGLVVMLAPLYLGYDCGTEGWCAEIRNASPAAIRAWGRYVGGRYKSFSNVVWVIGGDVDPSSAGVADKVETFVAGLKEADAVHLLTTHTARERPGATIPGRPSWADLDNVYSEALSYVSAWRKVQQGAVHPFFLVEAYYENEHASTPLTLRSQAYWAVLGGGTLGHVFGNCPIWSFGTAPGFCPGTSGWASQLESPGSATLPLVGRLFTSRRFHLLIPDIDHRVLTAGVETGATRATAARTADGGTIIAFVPTRRAIGIDLSAVTGGSARAWWFNPRDGSAAAAGVFPARGVHFFMPPDTHDWVLVVDNADLALPPPGSGPVVTQKDRIHH
jgi:Protein of unknown function (DUF4038)/Putative collagen-binding domain of a collagenase